MEWGREPQGRVPSPHHVPTITSQTLYCGLTGQVIFFLGAGGLSEGKNKINSVVMIMIHSVVEFYQLFFIP